MPKALLLLPLVFATIQCSVSSNKDDRNSDESYTYSFDYNGCKTGKHTFDAKKRYCAALLDDALNNGCALDMRRERYLGEKCGPKTWSDPTSDGGGDDSGDDDADDDVGDDTSGDDGDVVEEIAHAFVTGRGTVGATVVDNGALGDGYVSFIISIDVQSFEGANGLEANAGTFIRFEKSTVSMLTVDFCNVESMSGVVSFTGHSALQISGSGSDLCKVSLSGLDSIILDAFHGTSQNGKKVTRVTMTVEK